MTESVLSWLHISDLHVGIDDEGSDWPHNIELFLDDVKDVLEVARPVDLVIFTGDLSQSGKKEQFAELDEKVLAPLWQRLQDSGSNPVLLAVPGNHDLQRPDATRKPFAVELCQDPSKLWREDKDTLEFVRERFADYTAWWNAHPRRPKDGYSDGLLPGDFVYVHEKDGVRFGVAGLNTAALHFGDVDPGDLQVHKNQLSRALAGGHVSSWLAANDFNLLLTHHPPDWLSKANREEAFYGGLQAGAFDLHLFGHMHEPIGESRSQTSGARRRTLQAASLFGRERYTVVDDDGTRSSRGDRRYGYMVAHLVRDGSSCQLRAWPRRGFWAPDSHWRMGPDGSFALENDVLAAQLFELTPRQPLPAAPAPAPQVVPANQRAWDECVRTHRLWGRGLEHDAWRQRAVRLARSCRAAWDNAATGIGDDPWRDPGYPVRVIDHMARLADFDLEPLAAHQIFLLLTAPFAHEAVWAQGLAWLHGLAHSEDLEDHPDAREPRLTLQRTHRSYPRVVRLAERLDPPHRRVLTLWLLYHALDYLPAIWDPEQAPPGVTYEPLRSEAGDAFAPLCRLLRCVGGDISQLDALRDENDRVVAGTPVNQPRLATLMIAAGTMALDVRAVDELAVYHVGGPEGFAVEHLVEAANQVRWEARVGTWSLAHACRDPVQHYCLVELAIRADRLGKELRASDGALARGLPAELAATGVVPVRDDANQELFRPIHVLFRLDHNRIRDLLMGEALYGDPALALRELYQNALDACRYRRARNEYLRRTNPWYHQEYTGRIVFRQGTARDSRPFIECEDDGVGMSERTLERVFAVAGQRFHDRPAYLVEKARWEHHGIRLHPNSQHGIGVLSYFMLADELEIETREFREDGRPGRPLHVRISSASGLFHVRDSPTKQECGTRVRLYLSRTRYKARGRRKVERERELSVASILRELLIVAERATEVYGGVDERADTRTSGTLETDWQPGLPSIPPGDRWAVTPTDNPDLWWATLGECPVLVDGIRTDETCAYALVNLRNERYPKLSADRQKILSWDKGWIAQELVRAVGTLAKLPGLSLPLLFEMLLAHPETLVQWDALVGCAPSMPLLSGQEPDGISLWPENHGGRLKAKKTVVELRRIGFMPADRALFETTGEAAVPALWAWRLSVWQGTIRNTWPSLHASNPRLETASPSPAVLGLILAEAQSDLALWSEDKDPEIEVELPTGFWGRPLAEALRWAEKHLGLLYADLVDLEQVDRLAEISLEERDWRLLSLDFADEPSRLDGRVPSRHVLRVARELDMTVAQVATRLAELAQPFGLRLGFDAERLSELQLEASDLRLLSWKLNGRGPWLHGDVPALHALRAAQEFNIPVAEVVARLAELAQPFGLRLGFDTEQLPHLLIDESDWRLLSIKLDGYGPWLEGEVPALHVFHAAHELDMHVAKVAARLNELALTLSLRVDFAPARLAELHLEESDWRLLSEDIEDHPPWLEGDVPVWQALRAAYELGTPLAQVSARLTELALALGLRLDFDAARVAELQLEESDWELLRHLEDPRSRRHGDVSAMCVLRAGRQLGMSVAQVTARLAGLTAALGLRLDFDTARLAELHLEETDYRLLSRHFDDESLWLDGDVPATHVCAAARQLRKPVTSIVQRLHQLAPVLGLVLSPASAFIVSQEFETLADEVARRSTPEPYDTFDACVCTALWALQAAENVTKAVSDVERAILCAGRWWLWWLPDDAIRDMGKALVPVIAREQTSSSSDQ